MENITLGNIADWLKVFAALITGCTVIYKLISVAFKKALDSYTKPIIGKLEAMEQKIDTLERKHDLSAREHAKNFVICFLADVEQGEPIDPDELHCFWDNYDLYKSMGGNSYVHDKVEKLKAQGKL